MDSSDPHPVGIFEIYRRFCGVRYGKAYEEGRNGLDEKERCTFSRDGLAQLFKYVEFSVHSRISIFDELLKLMSKLEFMVDSSEFSRFYDFVYFMCREKGQKNITVDKAVAAWRLVLAGRFRLLNQWCEFVQENQRHNISEDTWQQVLAFSRCVHENLEGYDPEGAWPVLIDDFVEHMYRVSGSNSGANFICNCGDSESQSSVFEDSLPGLKILPGLKRKLPGIQKDIQVESPDDALVLESSDLNVQSNLKRSRLTVQRPLDWEDNPPGDLGGDSMEIIRQNSPLGSTKSPCAVEGCLSRGFAGLFSKSFLFAT